MTLLPEIGLIAANTSRTRAYMAAMEKHSLLPSWTLLLDDGSTDNAPGRVHQKRNSIKPIRERSKSWSESNFDPTAPLEPWLQRLGLSYVKAQSRDINDPVIVDLIAESEPSVLIYSGYGGVLLRQNVLACGKTFLHVHGGYLPDYKGSTTNYFSLLAENRLGASALFLTEEIDSGPLLARRHFPPPGDRRDIDHRYDSAARARVLIDVLQDFAATRQWSSQVHRGGSTYYIIHPVLKHIAILGPKGIV